METIQGGKLFKGGNYSQKNGMFFVQIYSQILFLPINFSNLNKKEATTPTIKSKQDKTHFFFASDPLPYTSLSPLVVINHWSNNDCSVISVVEF